MRFFLSAGNWYFEVKLTDLPEGAATRIGWAQKNANLQAPLGFDKFGYSCRLEMSPIDFLCLRSVLSDWDGDFGERKVLGRFGKLSFLKMA